MRKKLEMFEEEAFGLKVRAAGLRALLDATADRPRRRELERLIGRVKRAQERHERKLARFVKRHRGELEQGLAAEVEAGGSADQVLRAKRAIGIEN